MLNSLNASDLLLPRFQRLGWEFFWIGLGQGLSVLGSMVGVRLLTQMLNPTQYGELALGLTIGALGTQLSMGPLQQGILRFFGPAQEADELRAYLVGVRSLLARSTFLVLAIASLVIIGLMVSGHPDWIGLVAGAFLLAIISGYERALDAMQNAARHRAITAWHQALGQWLRFSLAVGLMAWLGTFSSIAMLGYCLATIIVLVSQFMFFRHKFSLAISSKSADQISAAKSWTRRIQNYAWPFATWGLFSWGQQSSDRWALQTFNLTRDVGYYSVLFQLGYMPITSLTGTMVQLLQPILFSRAGDGSDPFRVKRARQLNYLVVYVFLALTLLGTGLALIFHAQILALLVAHEYRGVSALLPWMVMSGGLFASGQIAALLLMSGVSTRALILPKIATALLGISLNLAGAYWLGLSGVVFASVGFSLTYLVWILVLSNRPRLMGMVSVT